ncbi:MAG: nucleotide exchange factor GrpE [Planctomycetes bacterium]|nr:nucleotide exchange factor GrpE [Planctomycetota bacterium]
MSADEMKKQNKNDQAEAEQAEHYENEPVETETDPSSEGSTASESAHAGDPVEAKLRRAMADLANIRRRHAKELEDARRRAIEGLASELLPVLDNFHLALAVQEASDHVSGDVKAMLEGLVMVRSLLEGTLERHGLSEIPSTRIPFDPNLHEAVGIDTESDAEAGTITKTMQRGYKIGDKVLRASRVIVAGQPDAPDSDED